MLLSSSWCLSFDVLFVDCCCVVVVVVVVVTDVGLLFVVVVVVVGIGLVLVSVVVLLLLLLLVVFLCGRRCGCCSLSFVVVWCSFLHTVWDRTKQPVLVGKNSH